MSGAYLVVGFLFTLGGSWAGRKFKEHYPGDPLAYVCYMMTVVMATISFGFYARDEVILESTNPLHAMILGLLAALIWFFVCHVFIWGRKKSKSHGSAT